MKSLLVLLTFLVFAPFVYSQELPEAFTFQGRAFQSDGYSVMTGTATFTVQILSQSPECVLYEEDHTGIDLTSSDGFFALKIGTGTKTFLGSSPMDVIFSNAGPINTDGSGTCGGSYTPVVTPTDQKEDRILRVQIDNGTSTVTLADQVILPVPQAIVAETLSYPLPHNLIAQGGAVVNQALIFNGSGWVPTNIVNQIVAGSGVSISGGTGTVTISVPAAGVGGSQIADNSVDTDHIIDGEVYSVDIQDETIVAADIAIGAVTTSEILDGTIIAADIATGAVGSDEVLDNSLTADDLAADSVEASELADNSVASANIIDGQVGSVDIGDGQVASVDIQDGTIVAADIATGAVTTIEILDNTITTDDIGTGGVASDEIADNSITTSDIGTGGVASDEIANGSIVDIDINANAQINIDKMADGDAAGDISYWNGSNWVLNTTDTCSAGTILLFDGTDWGCSSDGSSLDSSVSVNAPITGDGTSGSPLDIAAGGIDTAELASDAVTTLKILDANVTNAKLATDSVSTVKIIDSNITTPKIADNAVTSAKISDGTITNIDINANAQVDIDKMADGDAAGDISYWNGSNWVLNTTDTCSAGTILLFDGTDWACSSDGSSLDSSVSANAPITGDGTSGSPLDIAAGGIDTAELANDAVTTTKILNANVTTAKIADNAITSAKINDGEIVNADISATAGIAIDKMADGNAAGDIAYWSGTNWVINTTDTCAAGNMYRWTGSEWECSSNGTGLDVSINANSTRFTGSGTAASELDLAVGGIDPLTYLSLCAADETLKMNLAGTAWDCVAYAPEGTAGGDLTGTYPNPTIANDVVDLATIEFSGNNQVFMRNNAGTDVEAAVAVCGAGQYSKWNGTAWVCVAGSSTDTGITQLTGDVTAGPGSGSQAATIANDAVTSAKILDGTIAAADIDSTSVQERVASTCPAGQSIRAIAADGTVTCEVDDDTTYTSLPPDGAAGGELSGTYPNPNIASGVVDSDNIVNGTIVALDIDSTSVQERVASTCPAGQSIRAIAADGTVTCEVDTDTDTNTTYSAGTGLNLGGTVFSADTTYLQRRVSGTCAAGSSIRTISSTGTVTCETDTDTNTTYSAGNGISLSGTTFNVGGGDGLTQLATGLAVDSTVVRTSGDQTIAGRKTFTGDRTVIAGQTYTDTPSGHGFRIGTSIAPAINDQTLAVGSGIANGDGLGTNTTAIGSMAMNSANNTSNTRNTVVGALAFGVGGGAGGLATDNTIMGYQTAWADGYLSTLTGNTVIGSQARLDTASGEDRSYATAIGYGAYGDGDETTVVGAGARATGNQSVAIGRYAYARGSGNIAIGYDAGDVGSTYNNRLYIDNSNTASPLIGGDLSTNRVGIGRDVSSLTYNFEVQGQAGKTNGTTTWAVISDERLKTDIREFEYGLNELSQLQTKRFRYKEDNHRDMNSENENIGFIAQEVKDIIPEAVNLDEDGYYSLNVDPILWTAINAIQEVNNKCDMTNEQITTIDQKLVVLEKKVDREIASTKSELLNIIQKQQAQIDALSDRIKQLEDK